LITPKPGVGRVQQVKRCGADSSNTILGRRGGDEMGLNPIIFRIGDTEVTETDGRNMIVSQIGAKILQILTPIQIRIDKISSSVVTSAASEIKKGKIVRIYPNILCCQSNYEEGERRPKPDTRLPWASKKSGGDKNE
jgi:hypothetical protein